MLRATPRFPEEDSTRNDPGRSHPSRSAASTISTAAFSLTEPAKLKPSHFRKRDCPKIDLRSTYSPPSLNSSGLDITDMTPPHTVACDCSALPGRYRDRRWPRLSRQFYRLRNTGASTYIGGEIAIHPERSAARRPVAARTDSRARPG